MDESQIKGLFRDKPVASLATIGRDGTPHVVPIWAQLIDGQICMPTSSSTVKVRNLEGNDRAALMVHENKGSMALSGALIQGRIHVVRDAEALRKNREIHRRYLAPNDLHHPGISSYLSNDDVTLVLIPESVRTWNLSSVIEH